MPGNVKYRSSWRPQGQWDSHSIDKKSSHSLKMFCSLRQELQTLKEYMVHKLLAIAKNKNIFLFSYGSTLLTDKQYSTQNILLAGKWFEKDNSQILTICTEKKQS